MKRVKLSLAIVAALGLSTTALVDAGCTGKRGSASKEAHKDGAHADAGHPGGGTVVTMDQVDDSMNDKIKGERFRITYTEDDGFHGAAEPLVTIVEFSDFQCPYCSRFANMLTELMADPAYKDDVRVVFKQFPLPMHKQAKYGAQASLAAKDQGKFWEMHDMLFKNQKKMSEQDVEGFAKEIGLDVEAFKKAIAEKAGQVEADLKLGQQFGVRGTPSFFINGKWQRGAPRDISGLKKLIDAEKTEAEELVKAGAKRSEIYARIMKAAKTSRTPPPRPERKRAGQPDPKVNYGVPTDGRPQWGQADALVTIVEFSDFQCPFCNRVNPTMKQIKEQYPNDVRIVFRQMPLHIHPQAKPAAKASLAADRQGKFWEMHDKLFANQKGLNDQAFFTWAGEIGLDVEKFKKDYADPALDKIIAEDMKIAGQFGTRGTPSFYVNGRHISGARPFEQFDALIKEEKAKAEKFMAEKGVAKDKLYDEMIKGFEKELKVPPPPPPADHKRRDVKTDGLPGKGNTSNPKVTIVECSDFDCPFCKRATGTVDQIAKEMGDKVAIYFRNYPLPMHKNAKGAHVAAAAAGKQGADKFWAMHDLLFADKTKRSDDQLKEVAGQVPGLDVAKWEADFKDPATTAQVDTDIKTCQSLDVRGAPGFLINGRLLSGAQPFATFKKVIEEELNGGFEATLKKEAAAKKAAGAAKKPADKDGK